jgi:hypothetical protein
MPDGPLPSNGSRALLRLMQKGRRRPGPRPGSARRSTPRYAPRQLTRRITCWIWSWVRARLRRLIGGITWWIMQRLGRRIVRGWLWRIVQGGPPGCRRVRILGHKGIPFCFRDQCLPRWDCSTAARVRGLKWRDGTGITRGSGKPCPVCESKGTPIPDDEELSTRRPLPLSVREVRCRIVVSEAAAVNAMASGSQHSTMSAISHRTWSATPTATATYLVERPSQNG